MSNFKETLKNLRKYLFDNKETYNISEKTDGTGFVVLENIMNITCFVDYIVNDRCKSLSIAIHPCITCIESEKECLRKYFEEINNLFYSGQLLLDPNGAVYVQVSQKYIDASLSVETISFMFFEISSILDFTLDKLKQIVYIPQSNCYDT